MDGMEICCNLKSGPIWPFGPPKHHDDPRSLLPIVTNPAVRGTAVGAVEDFERKVAAETALKLFETGIRHACAAMVRGAQADELGQIRPGDKRISGAVVAVKVCPLPDEVSFRSKGAIAAGTAS